MDHKIRDHISKPYWASEEKEKLPGYDFCREIVEPGTNDSFPEGAIGLRVDDDFWAVAALPYSYLQWSAEDLVNNLWPNCFRATFHPDSGTLEQRVEFLERQLRMKEKMIAHMNVEIKELQKELRKYPPAVRKELS